jgi:hypothetical protein
MNTITELITKMMNTPEEFNHLKIFLHRENTKLPYEFGRKFLFVSQDKFGLVTLKDLSVENNHIYLYLEDSFTGQSGSFTIDTNDKTLKFLLIAWEDIQEMVVQDNSSTTKPVI